MAEYSMKYLVLYEYGPDTYSGFAPDVPGCASAGDSLDAIRANLCEALEFHLESLVMDGLKVPDALTHVVDLPMDGFAEWLEVKLPVVKAISA